MNYSFQFESKYFYYKVNLPVLSDMLDARAKGSVLLLDKNKDIFAWRGEQFGAIAKADNISIHLKNAILAVEDKRFYGQCGLSPRGIAGAIRINLTEGRGALSGHGGSLLCPAPTQVRPHLRGERRRRRLCRTRPQFPTQ